MKPERTLPPVRWTRTKPDEGYWRMVYSAQVGRYALTVRQPRGTGTWHWEVWLGSDRAAEGELMDLATAKYWALHFVERNTRSEEVPQ